MWMKFSATRFAMLSVAAVFWCATGAAQEAKPTFDRKALEEALAKPSAPSEEVAALIAQLGDESWTVRESAAAKLRRIGVAALPALKRAYLESRDAEIPPRAERLFREIVTPRMLAQTHQIALLGVSLQHAPQQPIQVAEVKEGSAAAKAGLQPDDVILALNGKEIEFAEGSNALRFPLWACGKGATVTLKISRGGREMDVRVTLEDGDTSQLNPSDLEAFEEWFWERWFEAHVKSDNPSKRSENRQ
jgi:predicted metalloprotease with PDZ domain